jgi:hypothetical protein
MTILRQTIILNTLADNAADAYVDSNGNLQLTGAAYGAPKATSCTLARQNAVSESLGIVTTTFVAVSGATYILKVSGGNSIRGGYNPTVKTYTYTATASDTATTIGDVFRAFINADVNILNIVATGTATLICTAKTGFAEIFISTTTANTTIVVTNQGVPSRGQGTVLATSPLYLTSNTYGTFTAGATYTRWSILWTAANVSAAPSSNSTAMNEYVVFINDAATAAYLDLLINTSYGTLTQLQLGYRAVVSASTVTVATAITTGILTFGAATLGAKPSDYFVVSPTVNVLVTGIVNATTGCATPANISTVATTYKVAVSNLPR